MKTLLSARGLPLNVVIFLAVIGSAVWVGVDASNLGMRRGLLGGGIYDMGVGSWVVCTLFVWILAFPMYFVARGRYQQARATGHGYFVPAAPAPAMAYAAPAPPPAPVHYSPDGHWWWDGQQWRPVQRPTH